MGSARLSAYEVLANVERGEAFADSLLDQELKSGKLQGPDRRLLTQLVYGILRHQGTLDHIIDQFAIQKTTKLERSVRLLLRIGLFQLLYLDRIPTSAAVNETVNLAKIHCSRAAGFVNAVLRNVDRNRATIQYPDQEKFPAEFLAARYSQPKWLVKLWIRQLGVPDASALAAAMAEEAPLTVRVNTIRTDRNGLLDLFTSNGIDCEPTALSPNGIRLLQHHHIPSLPGFAEGLFTVQDESSQLATILLDPQPGERILDPCAAPGGKAGHIAQIIGNSGEVWAGDINSSKRDLIASTATRLGLAINIVALDATTPPHTEKLPPAFDRLMLDLPCSALGVIRRNPEVKWRRKANDLLRFAEKQRLILRALSPLLKPGGTLLYSTCSTTTTENEDIVNEFLSHHKDFVVEDLRQLFPSWSNLFTSDGFFRSWPHKTEAMDGFFAARIRKIR